tara:strand:- start:105 stop:986 length:882 start_codon:yes stop_codon:yes gene_type:complete
MTDWHKVSESSRTTPSGMQLPERVWCTGAPGSRWAGVAAKLEDKCPVNFNTTDRLAPGRERDMCNANFTPASPKGFHKGAYFGQGMEFEAIVDGDYVDQAFVDKDHKGCKIIKSHEWAYKLPEIREKYPNDWIWMIYRPDDACFAWWYQLGGFNITYPDYTHYQNQSRIMSCIKEQNYNMLNFSYNFNASWNFMSTEWVRDQFGVLAYFQADKRWKYSPMYRDYDNPEFSEENDHKYSQEVWRKSTQFSKEANMLDSECPVTYKKVLPFCDILCTVIKPEMKWPDRKQEPIVE